MANKQDQLVQAILEQNQSLNATQLANRLGVSVRTVHNYLNKINSEYPGAISSTPTGYQISPQIARKILHNEPNEIPQTAAERCNYVLNRLIQNGSSLNLYDLCDEIYISTTTFRSLLGRMRRLTRDYDLTLTVSSDTVSLTGTERNKRRLLSSLLYHESSSAFTSIDALQEAFPSIDIEEIRTDVLEVLTECHYFINDYSLLNLLLHIAIAINRLSNGCDTGDQIPQTVQMNGQERDLARKLIGRLEKSFSIRFSPTESYELALLLISRASAQDKNEGEEQQGNREEQNGAEVQVKEQEHDGPANEEHGGANEHAHQHFDEFDDHGNIVGHARDERAGGKAVGLLDGEGHDMPIGITAEIVTEALCGARGGIGTERAEQTAEEGDDQHKTAEGQNNIEGSIGGATQELHERGGDGGLRNVPSDDAAVDNPGHEEGETEIGGHLSDHEEGGQEGKRAVGTQVAAKLHGRQAPFGGWVWRRMFSRIRRSRRCSSRFSCSVKPSIRMASCRSRRSRMARSAA